LLTLPKIAEQIVFSCDFSSARQVQTKLESIFQNCDFTFEVETPVSKLFTVTEESLIPTFVLVASMTLNYGHWT